jgi:hypothetical protein
MTEKTWFEGYNNYKKCTTTFDDNGKLTQFHTELLDVELMDTTNIHEIFNIHLSQRQTKTVEVLYSGGVDSEVVILSCIHNKIPVQALTMRIYTGDILVNTPDVYYSEKFCRENHIKQKFVDFDAVKFFDNGDHFEMIKPYSINHAGTALYFSLISQATGFVVRGGDYSWPWINKPIISPNQHRHSMYQQYMKDNSIGGIANMLSHSLDANLQFIKSHTELYNHNKHDPSNNIKLPYLKRDVFNQLGFMNLEPRIKAHGFEPLIKGASPYDAQCIELFGNSVSSISWCDSISKLIGSTDIRYNDRYS